MRRRVPDPLRRFASSAALVSTCLAAASLAQSRVDLASLATRPERTGYRETSRYDDVTAFLAAVDQASPLVHVTTFGYTFEGRPLPLAVAGRVKTASPEAVRASGKLRVYIQANIHAGEVEGKEALQILLREIAQGRHQAWFDALVLLVAPIYNADGNERIALTNRGPQHGPIGGMGQRPNAQGLDLNRDHMKLETPEARSLVRLLRDYDPHVVIDLHTTNGTRHAYHLTYAPPLHPNTDPAIDRLLRDQWLPALTRAIKDKYGWDYYYYGNLSGRGDDRGWYTYDHRPRFNSTYVGLRNRVGILGETYAYLTFEDRIAASRRFVEELLHYAAAHAADIRRATEEADRRPLVGASLALRARPKRSAEMVEILLGETTTERHPYTGRPMFRRLDVRKPERMYEYGAFEPTETERVPQAYYLPPALETAIERLEAHGLRLSRLDRASTLSVERFRIDKNTVAPQPFQNHQERTVEGVWEPADVELPAGTVVVPMDQPLARLAFLLLEPRSDDGLLDWNVLDEAIKDAKYYPILRSRP
jgi:hypothetical protein